MAKPTKKEFADIADQVIFVSERMRPEGIMSPLVLERRTRILAPKLCNNGFRAIGDLHGLTVSELVSRVPMTRPTFDRAMHHFGYCGVSLGAGQ